MLIKASFNQEVSTDGDSMVFILEGTHTITPSVNGKPKEITVRISTEHGEKIAQTLQASFEARQKSNPVRTIFDFDHKDTGPASAIPERFYYTTEHNMDDPVTCGQLTPTEAAYFATSLLLTINKLFIVFCVVF